MSRLTDNVNNSITLHRTTMNKGKAMSTDLRQQCNLLLSGHFDQHQLKPLRKWLNGAET